MAVVFIYLLLFLLFLYLTRGGHIETIVSFSNGPWPRKATLENGPLNHLWMDHWIIDWKETQIHSVTKHTALLGHKKTDNIVSKILKQLIWDQAVVWENTRCDITKSWHLRAWLDTFVGCMFDTPVLDKTSEKELKCTYEWTINQLTNMLHSYQYH